MSNDSSGKRIGFASFFANAKEISTEIPTPARSPPSGRTTLSLSKALASKAAHSATSPSVTLVSPVHRKQHSGDKRRDGSKLVGATKRNYKCIADPELDKTLPKGSKPTLRFGQQGDVPISVADPRISRDYASKVTVGKKRKYRPELHPLKWPHDQNSVGPDPPIAILIYELSPLTTSQEIAIQFRSFGEMSETQLQVDPSNGASLGICRICYRKSRSNHKAASEAAAKAVSKMHEAKLGGHIIKVEFDDDGKLCEMKFKEILSKREQAAKHAEIAAEKLTNARSRPTHAAEARGTLPKGPKAMQSTSQPARSHDRDLVGRDDRDHRTSREAKRYGRDSTFRTRDTSKLSSSTSETNERLGHFAYIFISNKVLPLHKVTAQELQLHFSGKKNKDIFTDHHGFYVLFDNDELATHAHKTMDKSTFLGYRLHMELHKAKKTPVIMQERPLGGAFRKTFQPVPSTVDPIMQATLKVVKELQEVFLRDIRSRVVGPALLEFLDPTHFRQFADVKPVTIKHELPSRNEIHVQVDDVKTRENPANHSTKKMTNILSHIPRFKKKADQSRDSGRMRVSHRMDHHAMYSDASDGSDDDSTEKTSNRPSSVAPSLDLEDDGQNTPLLKVKSKTMLRKVLQQRNSPASLSDESDLDSSSGDHRDKDSSLVAEEALPGPDDGRPARRHSVDFTSSSEDEEPMLDQARTALASDRSKSVVGPREEGKEQGDMEMPDVLEEIAAQDLKLQPTKKYRNELTGKNKGPVETISAASIEPDLDESSSSGDEDAAEVQGPGPAIDDDEVVLDIDGIQSIVKDDEDYDLLCELLRDVKPADIKNIPLWAWRQKERKATHAEGAKGVTKLAKENGYHRTNPSGSAKTEGYYPIPDIEKSFYLPNRNRAVVTEPGISNSSSRMNRANNRRQAAGIEAQRQTLEAQTDLLPLNALKSRKKQLKFSRSAIHDWGLYALEHIERGEMVIEYVGEIVRQQVADHREKRYERQGIGSSYLFRIDEDTVIDATKSGNIARFINHSCDPSCTAKIITVYGQKKIVIYAQRDIGLGEEITYDYKFPLEDEKIPCLCGSPICRKFLN